MRPKCVKIASKMRGTPLGENTFWTIPRISDSHSLLELSEFEVFFWGVLLGLVRNGQAAQRESFLVGSPADVCQDRFDHHKGQKSAISGLRLHCFFFIFSSVDRFPSSPGLLCNLVRKWPRNAEKIARFPGRETSAESCRVCGCHGFSVLSLCRYPGPTQKLSPCASERRKIKSGVEA